jgi:hypothetical protein
VNERQSSAGGVTFLGLLTVLFVALKLLGVVSWSWLWVLAPLWIPFALALLILIIGLVVYATKRRDGRRGR